MKTIKDIELGGERPCYGIHDLILDHVVFTSGESALKECGNVIARHCRFEGKYPLWHVDGFKVEQCDFTPGARAALWYSKNLEMSDTIVDAPKMFREMENMSLRNVKMTDAAETLWHCRGVNLRDVDIRKADYVFMHSSDIDIDHYHQEGNYSFQYCRNVTIRNAVLKTKDAFWNSENVTVIDSEIDGEYLAWHSRGLRLINCHIAGTQPLCYCKDLELINCTMGDDADLAFEFSDVRATINGHIVSVKNPKSGRIEADSIGQTIIDSFDRATTPVEIINRSTVD